MVGLNTSLMIGIARVAVSSMLMVHRVVTAWGSLTQMSWSSKQGLKAWEMETGSMEVIIQFSCDTKLDKSKELPNMTKRLGPDEKQYLEILTRLESATWVHSMSA
jgi:hypothetical protein